MGEEEEGEEVGIGAVDEAGTGAEEGEGAEAMVNNPGSEKILKV